MIVKRFTARTAEEALAMAKWELGEDAIILSSGKARDPWWRFWQSGFQVLVATDYTRRSAATAAQEAAPTMTASAEAIPVIQVGSVSPVPSHREPAISNEAADYRMDDVIHMLEGLGERLDRMQGIDDPEVEDTYQWLLERHVQDGWARKLADSVQTMMQEGEFGRDEALSEVLEERLGPPQPIALADPATVLFVGPTGSGKTTTIAKLAAYCHLERKKSVLLISTDTFRVAAVEQLKTYSEIIGIPFQVALRPQDIPHILKDRKADVVLIDTAGHSLNHALYMSEIRTVAELSRANDIQLVLPASMDSSLMQETARRFADGLSPKVCFTKVDEVQHIGGLLSCALTLGWPLSYLTDGQNVPDDIQVAFAKTLAMLLKGGA